MNFKFYEKTITIDIMTLFPEICNVFMKTGIIGRSIKKGITEFDCHQIRDFTNDPHKRVDRFPFGGGSGMLMMAEPIFRCYENIKSKRKIKPHLIFMSPKGKIFSQEIAKKMINYKNIAFLCGKYEGVDERVIEEIVDEQISIGDYVVSGGELPALVVIDAVLRMIPGVLSNNSSIEEESHYSNILEHPQYTRPRIWHNKSVPKILISGDHEKIKKWKYEKSIQETLKYRPDLIKKINKSDFT